MLEEWSDLEWFGAVYTFHVYMCFLLFVYVFYVDGICSYIDVIWCDAMYLVNIEPSGGDLAILPSCGCWHWAVGVQGAREKMVIYSCLVTGQVTEGRNDRIRIRMYSLSTSRSSDIFSCKHSSSADPRLSPWHSDPLLPAVGDPGWIIEMYLFCRIWGEERYSYMELMKYGVGMSGSLIDIDRFKKFWFDMFLP